MLDRLSAADRSRLAPRLERVLLAQDEDLYVAGQSLVFVYFIVTAQVRETLPLRTGEAELLRHIGAGEMAGSCALADPLTTRTARVSQSGEAWRMRYADFQDALQQLPAFRDLVMQDAVHAMRMP
jgi:CRP-like cAMP-binding protein